jgi:polysaccharide export outer membrane protein
MLLFFSGICAILSFSCADSRFSETKELIGLSSAVSPKTYLIGKGDILEIITWKEPDFSREALAVRTDGKISFPLLEDIQAAGRSPGQVRDEIEEKLKFYVTHPVVSVSVKAMESQKFYIIGEINKPGEYSLAKNLTVLHAIALAQGFTEWAEKDDIVLIRHENGSEKRIEIDFEEVVDGKKPDQNVRIRADDIIVVP